MVGEEGGGGWGPESLSRLKERKVGNGSGQDGTRVDTGFRGKAGEEIGCSDLG